MAEVAEVTEEVEEMEVEVVEVVTLDGLYPVLGMDGRAGCVQPRYDPWWKRTVMFSIVKSRATLSGWPSGVALCSASSSIGYFMIRCDMTGLNATRNMGRHAAMSHACRDEHGAKTDAERAMHPGTRPSTRRANR